MTRESLILGDLLPESAASPDVLAAEIGPLNRPLVSKAAVGEHGAVFYVDHCDTESLRQKWKDDPNVDVATLHVDAVWGQDALRAAIDRSELARSRGLQGRRLDFVVASHVIEHVPDLIGWLREIADILRSDGCLRLAVPDKRYCFDILRQPTGLVEVCEAWVCGQRIPSPGRILDFALNEVKVDLAQAWAGTLDLPRLAHAHTFNGAMALARDVAMNGSYHDVHCWVFTPLSFADLMADLAGQGLVPFECSRLIATPQGQLEFYAWLQRCDVPDQAADSWRQRALELQQAKPADTHQA